MGVRIRRGFDEVGTWETTSSFYLLPALSHPSSASSSSVVVSHPLLPTAIATLPTGTRTTGRQMWTRSSWTNHTRSPQRWPAEPGLLLWKEEEASQLWRTDIRRRRTGYRRRGEVFPSHRSRL